MSLFGRPAGYHHTQETRDKMSKSRIGLRVGSKNPLWKGGKPKCSVCEKTLRYGRKNCILHSKGSTTHGMWADKNYRSWLKNKRNKRLRTAVGSHTYREWLEVKKQHNYECVICKKSEPEIKLTRDHIIPLSKDGNNFIENIQPLCGSCNSRKNNKMEVLK